MDGLSTPPSEPFDDIYSGEAEFIYASPPSPFDGPPRPRTPSQELLADIQRRMPRKYPVEVKLLREASAQGHLQDVQQILSQYLSTQGLDPITSQIKLAMFRDSILEAIAHNHSDILSYLFSMQVGEPLLYINQAIAAESNSIFEVFLYHGWDINKPVERAMAPVLGYISHNKKLSEWFLDHGADPNAQCAWDLTPMSEAMCRASLDTIQMLFRRGGNITYGQLLHNAVLREGPDALLLVDLLLRKGASINEIQYQNHPRAFAEQSAFALGTPLHYAVKLAREDLVVFLINHGAELSIRDTRGRTALDIADARNMVKISQIIHDGLG